MANETAGIACAHDVGTDNATTDGVCAAANAYKTCGMVGRRIDEAFYGEVFDRRPTDNAERSSPLLAAVYL